MPTDVTDVTVRASGFWLGTRTVAGGTATGLIFFFLLQPMTPRTSGYIHKGSTIIPILNQSIYSSYLFKIQYNFVLSSTSRYSQKYISSRFMLNMLKPFLSSPILATSSRFNYPDYEVLHCEIFSTLHSHRFCVQIFYVLKYSQPSLRSSLKLFSYLHLGLSRGIYSVDLCLKC